MHDTSQDQRYRSRSFRARTGLTPQRVFSLIVCLTALVFSQTVAAQQRASDAGTSLSEEYQRAVLMILQQIDATRTFDDRTQRITVLVRAADLLWPYQQQRARTAFAEAFELATLYFKEKGDNPRAEGATLMVSTPDQRYVVLGAITKRDPAWGKRLTEQMLNEESKERQEAAMGTPQRDLATATKLLDAAFLVLPADAGTAVRFATKSLNYPASVGLPLFLYRLAAVSQPLADQLYAEALAAYSDKSMSEFLYLSSYPFGNDRDAGDMPAYARYPVPQGFVAKNSLQRLFLQTLLRRAQQALQNRPDTVSKISDPGQIWLALTRLEPQVKQSLPDLLAPAQQARDSIYVLLSPNSQTSLTQSIAASNAPAESFDERVEAAEKQSNVDERDQLLIGAVMRASENEDLDRVVGVVEKITDSTARRQVLDWLYFVRSQSALRNKQLYEARKLAANVEELDQRAYLFSQIAKESLETMKDDPTQARELLDDVVRAAEKAPATIVTARSLLAAAYLYAKFDINRSVAVLGEAIKYINRLDSPNFSNQVLIRRIEGKNFGAYATVQTPGFDPENTLREIGTRDFDTALYQASSFTDKSLKALTNLTLAELYLQRAEQRRKNKKTQEKMSEIRSKPIH